MSLGQTPNNPLFFVGNIPVRVNPMFVIVSLVMSGGGSFESALTWLVIVFISVLVHELGHAFVIARYGGEPMIELHAMGGTTSWSRRLSLTHWQRIWVSLAGPFAGFALGGAIFALSKAIPPTNDWMHMALGMAYWINFAWGAVNLLPIVPLDGGHVMQSLLSIRWPKRADAIADVITVLFATAALSIMLAIGLQFGALIIGFFAMPAFLRMKPHLERVVDALTFSAASDFIAACVASPALPDVTKAEKLVAGARTASGRRAAAEALLWALLDRRDTPRVAAVGEQYFRGQALSAAVESRVDTAFGRTNAAIARLEHQGTLGQGARELYAYVEACIAAGEEERAAKLLPALSGEQVLRVYAERALSAQRYADALAAFELGHQVFDGADWAFGAARALAREGRTEEAKEALKQGLSRDPSRSVGSDTDLAALG